MARMTSAKKLYLTKAHEKARVEWTKAYNHSLSRTDRESFEPMRTLYISLKRDIVNGLGYFLMKIAQLKRGFSIIQGNPFILIADAIWIHLLSVHLG